MYNIPRFVDKLLYYFIAFVKCHLKHAKRLLRFFLLIQILSAIFQCSKYHKSISIQFVMIPHLLDVLLLEQIIILKLSLALVFIITFPNVALATATGSAVIGTNYYVITCTVTATPVATLWSWTKHQSVVVQQSQ